MLFIKSILLNSIDRYLKSFQKNTSRTIFKGFNQNSFQIYLFTRGCSAINKFNLHEIIFDSDLVTNLIPESAAIIGYHYGVNYSKMLKKNDGRIFNYSISQKNNFSNFLTSICRNNYINFISKLNDNKSISYSMHPLEIINNQNVINKFHPSHACYIGILAGINQIKLKA